MPTIADLNQRQPCIDEDEREDLRALYEGGKRFKARLQKFLLQRDAEPPTRYDLRKKEAHYRNYLGTIIDLFAAMLFTAKPAPTAKTEKGEAVPDPGQFYGDFVSNCDRNDTDLCVFMKGRLTEAMVLGCSWLSVEAPDGSGDFSGVKAEYERQKLGDCWLRELPSESVLDWDTDDAGALTWVVVHTVNPVRQALGGNKTTIVERWEHYQADKIDVYEIAYPKDKPPADNTEVPLARTRTHRFGSVPVVCLDLPTALHVAGRLCSPQLAHFRMSNAQTWSITNTCFAMPVFSVKDPEEFQRTAMGAGYGFTIGADETATYLAPPGQHFAALDVEIKAQKDEIFRLAHQMALGVENNAAAVGRTAESKIEDSKSTRIVLLAFSELVKEAIERIFDLLEAARGDKYEWTITGLDEFAGMGLDGLLAVLKQIGDIGGVPSREFRVFMLQKLAEEAAADMDEELMAKVREEIATNTREVLDETPEERDVRVMYEAAAKASAGTKTNGPPKPPGPGRGGPPGAPKGGGGGARPAPPVA